jgi:hypothetical protein
MAVAENNGQNEFLCKLKLSIETLFDNSKEPLEKFGKLVDIAVNPLPAGACGTGENPISSGHCFISKNEYNVVRNFIQNSSETTKRTDRIFTGISKILYLSEHQQSFDKDNFVGNMTFDGLAINNPENPYQVFAKADAQITLDKSKIFDEFTKNENELENLVTFRPILSTQVFDAKNRKTILKLVNSSVQGSDNLWYVISQVPSHHFTNDGKLLNEKLLFETYYVYKFEVYKNYIDSENARKNIDEKNIKIFEENNIKSFDL